ncbi:MAG: zinc-dependent metalloprotease [Vicinamibacterales bacterium]
MRLLFAVLLATLVAGPAFAQDPPAPPQEPPAPAGAATPGGGANGGGGQDTSIRPYERVVTKEARTDEGVFTVHRIKERLLYEIPKTMLDREFLLVTTIARTTEGSGYGGQEVGSRVVKWMRQGDRVLLRGISYRIVADPAKPIARAVQAANYDAIIMAFPIQALGKDEASVIDVSRLFTTDVPEFSARQQVRARAFDASRSFVERAVSFPRNVEVESTQTFNNPPEAAGPMPGPGGPVRPGSASVLVHYSMVLLPETPMQPRLFDERVGFFNLRQIDYGKDEARAPVRRYIRRWRLEKKDPAAAVSEPVTPITYYVDPATPTKWVPYVKRGVEAWQASFEAAGFRGAIVAKDAPTPAEDPDWSPEDSRYSVLRWLPSTVENAYGPHIHDPRTGEILESDIQLHQNLMNLVRDWYVVQVGALDPRARHLPLPDDLMGRLVQMVVTHEVGHTLGLQHNLKASAMYPAAKMRDKVWVKTMGFTPSIMDYARMNYVAQPEDGFDPDDLIPRIGPYDTWAIKWGYSPVANAADADAEKSTLDTWAREQDATPWLRFSTPDARGSDPADNMEAIGDDDAVASTRAGVKNLERLAGMLVSATADPGEPYDDLEELYSRMLGQWTLEMNHVAALVGGVRSQQKHNGQDGLRFTPVPLAQQAAATAFLIEQAFHVPASFVKPDMLRRIEPAGALGRIRTSQVRVLDNLLGSARLNRLAEQEAIDGVAAYAPTAFLADVRKGVWSESYGTTAPRVNAFRRNLQRAHIDAMAERVSGRTAAPDDVRALFRGELKTLDADLRLARSRTTDRATALHLEDARAQIAKALDPGNVPAAAPPPAAPRTGLADDADTASAQPELDNCWQDYAIR